MTQKILVTLGPSSMSESVVRRCADLGVHLFRINLSHTPLADVAPAIEKVRAWTDVPICLDSEGAQLRNQGMAGGTVVLEQGNEVAIHFEPVLGDLANISFTPAGMARQFVVGDEIGIDFDHARLKVTRRLDDRCLAVVVSGGEVGSNKAADVERELEFEAITPKDRKAVEIGRRLGIRDYALSFANYADDVAAMRALIGPDARLICKVESPAGLKNLDGIVERADAILIDRGDLSRRVPIEKVPFLQRKIIATARQRNTPVFVATNLLESMVTRRSPTRAEVNDVVSTLLMGADGLVLAAETAIGKYPVEAVRMVRRLIDESAIWMRDASIPEILET